MALAAYCCRNVPRRATTSFAPYGRWTPSNLALRSHASVSQGLGKLAIERKQHILGLEGLGGHWAARFALHVVRSSESPYLLVMFVQTRRSDRVVQSTRFGNCLSLSLSQFVSNALLIAAVGPKVCAPQ